MRGNAVIGVRGDARVAGQAAVRGDVVEVKQALNRLGVTRALRRVRRLRHLLERVLVRVQGPRGADEQEEEEEERDEAFHHTPVDQHGERDDLALRVVPVDIRHQLPRGIHGGLGAHVSGPKRDGARAGDSPPGIVGTDVSNLSDDSNVSSTVYGRC